MKIGYLKRVLSLLLIIGLCFTLTSCKKNKKEAKKLADETVMATNTEDCKDYSLEKYMLPYWESDVIYNESVMPLRNADGTVDPITLMYDIGEIVSVKNSFLNITYEPHKDYIVNDGKLVLLTDGKIPFVEYGLMFPDPQQAALMQGNIQPHKTNGYMYFAEGSTFHGMQLAVSYIPKGKWEGPAPESKSQLLPATMQKLQNGENLKMVVYGDSISVGANSSQFVSAAPYCPNYFDMLKESLENKYGSKIRLANPSVGGVTSSWGVENVQDLVVKQNPDLVIIAFGMNDGSKGTNAPAFIENIENIMSAIKAANPNCEFILISTMKQNDNWPNAAAQERYLEPLLELETTGCAVADVTSVHKYLLEKKRYMDMSGNHVNHPNDFIVRLYAQILFKMFE